MPRAQRTGWRFAVGFAMPALIVAGYGSAEARGASSTSPPVTSAEPGTGGDCAEPGTCEPADELIEAAQAEGEVVTFSAISSGLQEQFADAFEEQYGITVNFSQVQVGEGIERARTEFEAGQVSVDLLNHSDDRAHADMTTLGAYAELDVGVIPNLAAVTDEDEEYHGTYAFWGGPAYGLAWNTELVSADEVPESWCELADPSWRGRIGLVDQPGASSIYASYQLMEEVCGDGFLEELAQNDIVWFVSTAPAAEALAAGEVAVADVVVHTVLGEQADGAPVGVKVVDGMAVGARWMAVMNDAPHPNAARLFANWLLSAEAQQLAYSGQQGVSVLPNDLVPDTVIPPEHSLLATSEDFPPEVVSEIRQQLGLE